MPTSVTGFAPLSSQVSISIAEEKTRTTFASELGLILAISKSTRECATWKSLFLMFDSCPNVYVFIFPSYVLLIIIIQKFYLLKTFFRVCDFFTRIFKSSL